ncbi:hypothetical protein ACLBXM_19090 [Xanthobacteraceae bacterium A53D]
MSTRAPSPDDTARLLAELHIARGLAREMAQPRLDGETAQPRLASISTAQLWAHVRRAPDAPVSLPVERALRTDPEAARRYRTLLASAALAHAPLAIAAATGAVSTRRMGEVTLTIDAGDEDAAPLVILSGFGPRAPGLIELLLGDESLRLALPAPANGAILLSADPAIPEMERLLRLLRDPATEIFLL